MLMYASKAVSISCIKSQWTLVRRQQCTSLITFCTNEIFPEGQMCLLGLSIHSGLNYDLGYTNESLPVGEASEYAIERRIYYRASKHNTKKKKKKDKIQ